MVVASGVPEPFKKGPPIGIKQPLCYLALSRLIAHEVPPPEPYRRTEHHHRFAFRGRRTAASFDAHCLFDGLNASACRFWKDSFDLRQYPLNGWCRRLEAAISSEEQ